MSLIYVLSLAAGSGPGLADPRRARSRPMARGDLLDRPCALALQQVTSARCGAPKKVVNRPMYGLNSGLVMAIDDRLLRVLRAFNEDGPGTVLQVARRTGISRAAVHRIVETLRESGYLRRIPGTSTDQVTALVKSLSVGWRDEAWISEDGARVIAALQDRVRWPTSLAVPDKGELIIRETTRFRSPFVFDAGMVGKRLPMFASALGLAYFAFASEPTRAIILELTSGKGRKVGVSGAQLARILQRGYAVRVGGIQPRTASLAVPILCLDESVGSICVTYARTAVSQAKAARDFAPLLREAAAIVGSAYHRAS
jgi:IclR family mhp operon transcriptional activator